MTEKIKTKGKKYFLVFFWNKIIKHIKNKNSIIGILFPERIIPKEKTTNKNGTTKNKIFFERMLKNNGKTKKANKENLCIYPPAINSSPNGPPSFLEGLAGKPNISFPKINWINKSKHTNKEEIAQIE